MSRPPTTHCSPTERAVPAGHRFEQPLAQDARGPLRGMRARLPVRLLAAAVLLLAGCGGDLQTPGEALRVFGANLPQAFAGEPYNAPVRVVGGLRPFNYTLSDGELPPGLELQNGVIRGVPREVGRFSFTVTVSDANLSRTFQEYTLTVVERPPPVLNLVAPETEVREATTLRLRLENASEVRAVSSRFIWDDETFELVTDSVAAARPGTGLLWETGPGWLQVDLVALGGGWNGELTLGSFMLAPASPALIDVNTTARFLDDRGGESFQGQVVAAAAADEETASEDEPEESDSAVPAVGAGTESDPAGNAPDDDESDPPEREEDQP